MSGCKDPPTWSAEARSPDGKMTATALAFENSGFGGGPPTTFVYLNWTTGSRPKTLILESSEGQPEPNGIWVRMNWLTPTHLELAYKGQRTIDFQAVKYAGVDISVQEIPNETDSKSK